MWMLFNGLYEFVAILLHFYVLAFWLQGIGDLSCLTRDQTCASCIGSLSYWTTREVPSTPFLFLDTPYKHFPNLRPQTVIILFYFMDPKTLSFFPLVCVCVCVCVCSHVHAQSLSHVQLFVTS